MLSLQTSICDLKRGEIFECYADPSFPTRITWTKDERRLNDRLKRVALAPVYTFVIREEDIRPSAEELVTFLKTNGDLIKSLHIDFMKNSEVTQPISDIELDAIAVFSKHHELCIKSKHLDSRSARCITPQTTEVQLYETTLSEVDTQFLESCRRQRCKVVFWHCLLSDDIANQIVAALAGCKFVSERTHNDVLLRHSSSVFEDLYTTQEAASFASQIQRGNLLTSLDVLIPSEDVLTSFCDECVSLPQLTKLKLEFDNPELVDTHLDRVVSNFSDLHYLKVQSAKGLTSEATSSLKKLRGLRTLKVEDSIPLTDLSCAGIVRSCPQLQRLSWQDVQRPLTADIIEHLMQLSNLTSVCIIASSSTSKSAVLEAFSRLCLLPNIEELHLPEIPTDMAEVEKLLSKIPQNSKLAYIAFNTGDINSDCDGVRIVRACNNRYYIMGKKINPVKVVQKRCEHAC